MEQVWGEDGRQEKERDGRAGVWWLNGSWAQEWVHIEVEVRANTLEWWADGTWAMQHEAEELLDSHSSQRLTWADFSTHERLAWGEARDQSGV